MICLSAYYVCYYELFSFFPRCQGICVDYTIIPSLNEEKLEYILMVSTMYCFILSSTCQSYEHCMLSGVVNLRLIPKYRILIGIHASERKGLLCNYQVHHS
jgi:hypothetical protein